MQGARVMLMPDGIFDDYSVTTVDAMLQLLQSPAFTSRWTKPPPSPAPATAAATAAAATAAAAAAAAPCRLNDMAENRKQVAAVVKKETMINEEQKEKKQTAAVEVALAAASVPQEYTSVCCVMGKLDEVRDLVAASMVCKRWWCASMYNSAWLGIMEQHKMLQALQQRQQQPPPPSLLSRGLYIQQVLSHKHSTRLCIVPTAPTTV